MSGFFPDIRAAEGALQQEAFTRWQAMGDLRRREKETGKKFKLTLTTNGLLWAMM